MADPHAGDPDDSPHPRRALHIEPGRGFIGPEDRIEHHTRTLDRAIQLTFIADAKAAPILALQATLAAVSVSQLSPILDLLSPSHHTGGAIVGAWLLFAAYAATALVALTLASLVFLPRANRSPQRSDEDRSLVFFEDIRSLPEEEFRRRSKLLREEQLEDDLLTQVYAVSSIASAKFSHVMSAYLASAAGLCLWLALMVWARV